MSEFKIAHHAFTDQIILILEKHFGNDASDIFKGSSLLGYLNNKTKAANRGSKARAAFANHYALYVIIEDYLKHGYFEDKSKSYSKYEGARFSELFKRQRELPFGSKLQNHALNARLNDEFKKFYPMIDKEPIVRDVATQRYWIQEDFLKIRIRRKDGKDKEFNISKAIIEIIDTYVATKKAAFESFLETCRQIANLGESDHKQAIDFVTSQLQPNVDARVFEVVSYAVLKAKYGKESVWIGQTKNTVEEESLVLYKTGRTNANDGGIDFVMKPSGRFFQVTETLDVKKYFLDIDKVQRFPVTFVVKSDETEIQIRKKIEEKAIEKYKIDAVVRAYMNAIEEIINTESLIKYFNKIVQSGCLNEVMDEIVIQSKLEFNYNKDQ